MADIKIDSSIDYSQKDTKMSKYKLSQIIQQTGGQAVTIGTSQQTSIFEIPVNTYNLAQSVLSFTETVPALASKVSFAYRNTPPIAQLQLYSRSGAFLADISHFNNFCVSTLPHSKPTGDFLSSKNDILVFNPATSPILNGFGSISDIYTELKSDLSVNPDTPVVINWQIMGSELVNTIMSLDKSLYIPEVLNLKIVWLDRSKVGFTADDIKFGNATALASDVQISNLKFLLAVEQNEAAVVALRNQTLTSGMSVMFPSSTCYKTTLQPSTVHAVSVRASRGMGERLERVYTTWVVGNETVENVYFSNAQEVNNFYSLLDSVRQQEFNIVTASQDYRAIMRSLIRDKVASADSNLENYFAFQESWCDDMISCAANQERAGKDLNVERKYDFYANYNAPASEQSNYYTTVVCQRQLMLMPSGVQVS